MQIPILKHFGNHMWRSGKFTSLFSPFLSAFCPKHESWRRARCARAEVKTKCAYTGISYPIPARPSGSSAGPGCGCPNPPANIPPWCCRPTPAPGTSRCCWWGRAGRAGSPTPPAQKPAPAARTCSCFSASPHRAPSPGCSTCGGSAIIKKKKKGKLIKRQRAGRA